MIRLILFAATLLGGVTAINAQRAPDFSPIEPQINRLLVADHVPAMAVAVTRRGKIIWEQGFGWADRERHIKATANTPFYLASVTKSLTSTAVMVLIQSGKIDWDSSINNYLGPAKVHSPMWNPQDATVRRLATHMSGLTTFYRACNVADPHCQISIDGEIARYGTLFWPPGERFDYSNLGYAILGEAVAHASGDSFAHFLQANVLQPLGMNHCSLNRPQDAAANYNQHTDQRASNQISGSPGASAAYCSAHDLALFAMFQLKDHLRSQRQILTDAALDELHRPVTHLGGDQQYAIGFWTTTRGGEPAVFGQGGTTDSFTLLEFFPAEDVAIVMLANSWSDEFNSPNSIEQAMRAVVLPQVDPKRLAAEDQAATQPMSSALTGRWSGEIETVSGKLPITITITGATEAHGHVGSAPDSALRDLSIKGEHLYGVLSTDLHEDDAPPSPYEIEFDLFLRGHTLAGAGTTRPGPKSNAQLPHWVEMHQLD
jgi:CubicO group peptidase (beta-lactamase class C family)